MNNKKEEENNAVDSIAEGMRTRMWTRIRTKMKVTLIVMAMVESKE